MSETYTTNGTNGWCASLTNSGGTSKGTSGGYYITTDSLNTNDWSYQPFGISIHNLLSNCHIQQLD